MANEPHVELLAEKLGQFLIVLAGADRRAVRAAADALLCAQTVAARPKIVSFAAIVAAEFMWSALDERRRRGWPAEGHRAALTAIETVLETALADLSRRGAMGLGAGKAVS